MGLLSKAKEKLQKKMAERAERIKKNKAFQAEMQQIEKETYVETFRTEATKAAKKRGVARAKAAANQNGKGRGILAELRKLKIQQPDLWGKGIDGKPLRPRKNKEKESREKKGIA